ncbi:hypothetical protein J8F10_24120 [Gemmata sp. G18]|uniref:Uncharacterized protein n=1 Tax=Gemmata palustris TaxID=2822762 RepID=A0ABS5BY62_9BACT|nr:hypothetical protein [Gemmata palustris]MBP3958347.1 hypothetical protein [Gemmata palustris]
MKNYRILKSFKGSQTGHDCHEFEAGTEARLSDSLAEVVVKEGWAELIAPVPEPEPEIEAVVDAEARETKVIKPEETKPVKPLLTKKPKK